ncbi:DUF1330 domain-containing protein [Vibrio europaeus]|uniref:DUF1330 domain-containing protein n=1 Tax=Vibrio europaeus TaxID=300876 RepID=A0A178JDA1_9VIBR|nr:DUF1330 domain-containing protein [Vibrio europaeus]MDC5707657.1 DUF1330 domain-containing protein [Vibrio europaeus]MDC5709903.1 DUF1330 domain-containing protein [Vibrio europaeus]MDC5716620.1 DUF1330 domain-containing protein [Vibrio europaeus]MDC5722761.1 DUF1330 domain-containing protein [Vibrio europaeus]MDC5726940.1 DUF1330 domain-containing protein [Vibrio europaeus]
MYEFLVGLEVSNSEIYSEYRAAMKPILKSFGGGFGFDFVVSEVLLSEVDERINRVFTIQFPNQKVAEAFFSDSEYLKVKAQYFDASVSQTTIISSYEKVT